MVRNDALHTADMDVLQSPSVGVQEKFLAWARGRKTLALFAPAGSGKTRMVLRWADTWREYTRDILVVCPKGGKKKDLIKFWHDEATALGVHVRIVPISRLDIDNVHVEPHTILIVDESTYIKNPKAKRTKAVVRLGRVAGYKAILSALPNPQGLHELFSQYLFLDCGQSFGTSYWAFLENFFYKSWKFAPWLPTKQGKECIEAVLARTAFAVSQKEAFVIPPQGTSLVPIEAVEEQKRIIKQLKEEFRAVVGNKEVEVNYAITVLQKVLQCCSGFMYAGEGQKAEVASLKPMALHDIVCRPESRGEVLVWCNYKETAKMVERHMDRWSCVRVLSYHKHAHGINIPTAKTVVYYEPCFSVEKSFQASKRHRRITTTTSSRSYHLYTKGTPEEDVVMRVRKKEAMSLRVLASIIKKRFTS